MGSTINVTTSPTSSLIQSSHTYIYVYLGVLIHDLKIYYINTGV